METSDSSEGFFPNQQPKISPILALNWPPTAEVGGASISQHAMLGSPNLKTMRLCGMINQEKAMMLVDLGNTYNFLDSNFVKKTSTRIQSSKPLEVKVANGASIRCLGTYTKVSMGIQGHTFQMDAYVLDLYGCNVVLKI